MQAPSVRLLRALAQSTSSGACRHCVRRTFYTSARCFEDSKVDESSLRTPELKHRRSRDGELQPKPLSKPLGLTYPPRPGQNTGKDTRTWQQKRDDFASYEKHIERRKKIMSEVLEKNYYRDIGNLGKIHRGKSILAPSTPFRANLALYFPNIFGETLVSGKAGADTSPVMRNRVSIVSILNTEWAAGQARTFTSEAANPGLHQLLRSPEAREAGAQLVTINVEENWLKAAMIRLFFWRLRKQLPKEQHDRYFLNKIGLSEEIRDALGVWNTKVGYVYLVDGNCKVRWAGNGEARADEKQSLINCTKRLVDEARGVQRIRIQRQDPKPTGPIKHDDAGEHAVPAPA